MSYPDNTSSILMFRGYVPRVDYVVSVMGTVTLDWSHVDPKPTDTQVNAWGASQEYADWLDRQTDPGDYRVTGAEIRATYDKQAYKSLQNKCKNDDEGQYNLATYVDAPNSWDITDQGLIDCEAYFDNMNPSQSNQGFKDLLGI